MHAPTFTSDDDNEIAILTAFIGSVKAFTICTLAALHITTNYYGATRQEQLGRIIRLEHTAGLEQPQ